MASPFDLGVDIAGIVLFGCGIVAPLLIKTLRLHSSKTTHSILTMTSVFSFFLLVNYMLLATEHFDYASRDDGHRFIFSRWIFYALAQYPLTYILLIARNADERLVRSQNSGYSETEVAAATVSSVGSFLFLMVSGFIADRGAYTMIGVWIFLLIVRSVALSLQAPSIRRTTAQIVTEWTSTVLLSVYGLFLILGPTRERVTADYLVENVAYLVCDFGLFVVSLVTGLTLESKGNKIQKE